MSIRLCLAGAALHGALLVGASHADAQSLPPRAASGLEKQMFTARNFPGNRSFQSAYTPDGGRLARVLLGPFTGMGAGVLFGGLFGLAASYGVGGLVPCDAICSAAAATVGFAVGWGLGIVFGVTWVGERYGGRGSWVGSTLGAFVFGFGGTALAVWAATNQQWGWLAPAALLPAIGATLGYEVETLYETRARPAGPPFYRYGLRIAPSVMPITLGGGGVALGVVGAF